MRDDVARCENSETLYYRSSGNHPFVNKDDYYELAEPKHLTIIDFRKSTFSARNTIRYDFFILRVRNDISIIDFHHVQT